MGLALVGVTLGLSLWLAWRRAFEWLIVVALFASVFQLPLVTLFQDPSFVYIDDVAVCVLVASASLVALSRDRRALILYACLGLLAGIAFLRTDHSAVGFAQLRQVLLPMGLVLAGRVLAVDGRRIRWAVIGLASFSALWALLEIILRTPLMDPSWYATHVLGASQSGLRNGLPSSYYADGVIRGEPLFRAGGPFFNPPMLALFLAGGAYACMRQLKGAARVVALTILAAASVASFGRAGMLIFAAVTVLAVLWQRVNHLVIVSCAAVVGGAVAFAFLRQGNTGSHSAGLVSGFTTALTNPLGIGFGSTGYQAALHGGKVGPGSESLLGLYFAWLGLPLVLLTIGIVVWLCRALVTDRLAPIDAFLGLGVLGAAALSESASALGATAFLWYMLGVALAPTPTDGRTKSVAVGGTKV